MWYVHDLFSLLQLYESERKDWPFFFISIIMNLMFNIIIINFKEKITTFKGPFDEIEEEVGGRQHKQRGQIDVNRENQVNYSSFEKTLTK